MTFLIILELTWMAPLRVALLGSTLEGLSLRKKKPLALLRAFGAER
jgi:hypothetical protein